MLRVGSTLVALSLAVLPACAVRTTDPVSAGTSSVPASTVPSTESTSAPSTIDDTTTLTPTTEAEPLAVPITPTGDATRDASLLSMARFVEGERGHPFLEPVTVQFLDDAAFEDVVLSGLQDDGAVRALEAQQQLLVALELLPAGVDFVQLVRISQREGVVGLYVPSTKELYVRGTNITPLVRTTVVHELTHAIDDQWFSLDRRNMNADEGFAASSLAEGSATLVEERYVDTMSSADVAAAGRESDEFIAQMEQPDWPLSVNELSESVYTLGHRFVSGIVDDGGMAALDSAFQSPPRSTEQLLHPERYAGADAPVQVAPPDTDGVLLLEGVMGEWSLVELLNAELAPADARGAAEGWGGDRYALVDDGYRHCVVLDVQMDTDVDADELESAFGRWAIRQYDAAVERLDERSLRITACGDGTG